MDGDIDRGLVEALRERAPGAAERLVARHGRRAYHWARRVTAQAADAEEVAQDALWAVIRKIDTFRGNAAFASWLYRIVANLAYAKVRQRNARRDTTSLTALPKVAGATLDPARRTELRGDLTAALDELPAGHRAPLLLRAVDGGSNAEVGRALGLSVGSVKSRVHRARVFVRGRLAV